MRGFPLHPWLIAAVPVTYLYAYNAAETPIAYVVAPLLLSLAVATLVVAVLRLVSDGWRRAALCASPLVFCFGTIGRYDSLVAAVVILIALAAVHAASRASGSIVRSLTQVLNAFGASFLLISATSVFTAPSPPAIHHPPLPVAVVPDSNRPDVLLIVTDGHGRADVLQESFPVEQPDIETQLEKRGFSIARCAMANHNMTALSFATMFNLDYLPSLLPTLTSDTEGLGPAASTLKKPWLFDAMRAGGYEIVVYPSAYNVITYHRSADLIRDGAWTHEFWRGFEETSAYASLRAAWLAVRLFTGGTVGGIAGERLYSQLEYMLADLPNVAAGIHPRLVVVHLHSPHVPFLFDRQGAARTAEDVRYVEDGPDWHHDDPALVREYRRLYADQVGYLDDRMIAAIDAFLAQARRPVIVMVTADHGPWSQKEGTAAHLRERMSILHAVRWPEAPPVGWHDAITPVNTMRLIVNRALGISLLPLEDRSSYSTYKRPYDFSLVDPKLGMARDN